MTVSYPVESLLETTYTHVTRAHRAPSSQTRTQTQTQITPENVLTSSGTDLAEKEHDNYALVLIRSYPMEIRIVFVTFD